MDDNSKYTHTTKKPNSKYNTITPCERSSHVRDLTGQRFGRLVVEKYLGVNGWHTAMWGCKCDCGNFSFTSGAALVAGSATSCGCVHSEYARLPWDSKRKQKLREQHPKPEHPRLHHIWLRINYYATTEAKSQERYTKSLRERGIVVCDEWKDYAVFEKWALANGWDEKQRSFLRRISSYVSWQPDNCYIDHNSAHSYNPGYRVYTMDGRTQCLSSWAKEFGMDYNTLKRRLQQCGGDLSKVDRNNKIKYPKKRASRLPVLNANRKLKQQKGEL